ncbi:hypothetical protein Ssi03_69760 [Sphaerisporangium siamense]|uniref:Poly-gamma-glutamate synthesis protein (Capsule biosynthesis protein) n=1 Tax=Sphaerisporangium siamense TaxID=795645 RepID=A0A7W7D9A6_9ACTN|nr:CapA family protein [Sphaerisporangium siamense]MBB4702379.1 poly-gamma-glutamate synthesis protein (capsule biosynthesis protein) [Sphaerisporangium siamense]GII88986.1 hypothetical protein Ssi03_69760 [Sphaerisporangium siamense]
MTVALCGDVMLGRGVDQILPHPGDPALREPSVRDARAYVGLAEGVNGPIPCPVPFTWPWGDALRVLREAAVRVVNLETSVTSGGEYSPGKVIHYRMHPANLPCLAAAWPDVCVLANNHVLDFGRHGLEETLGALAGAGLSVAGAGRDEREARRPAIVPAGGGRVLVFAAGTESSGVPADWAATSERSGVDLLPDLSEATAAEVTARVRRAKRPGDIAVVSLHWGSNWGYHVPACRIRFAHMLIDGGADIVHGHSSHHPRPVEVYQGKLVLYGCGDLIDDYEGIPGYERFRDDLRLVYLASVDPASGLLAGLRLVPLAARRMRLERAGPEDRAWLRQVLEEVSRELGEETGAAAPRIGQEEDGDLVLRW